MRKKEQNKVSEETTRMTFVEEIQFQGYSNDVFSYTFFIYIILQKNEKKK
jgi:hypothetical protein